MHYDIKQGNEVKYLGLQNAQFWGKAIHDLQHGQEQMEVESLTTPGLIISLNVKDIVSVHSVTSNVGTVSRYILLDSVPLGGLTARWTQNNQLVLTSAQVQHICSADEVAALLEMLYQHKEAIHGATHQHDQGQASTPPPTTDEQKPRYHVINDTHAQIDSEWDSTGNRDVLRLDADLQHRILNLAEYHGKTHYGVADCKAHLSQRDASGMFEHLDGDEDTWLVCLDMPGVGDIQRVVVAMSAAGILSIDHRYTDNAGCYECQHGRKQWFMPGDSGSQQDGGERRCGV